MEFGWYKKTYWCRNGAEQAKMDEMEKAGFEFTRKTEAVLYSYYRYFNDGDFPGWARKDWSLVTYDGRGNKVLNEKGIALQENRVSAAVLAEYARYMKAKGVA